MVDQNTLRKRKLEQVFFENYIFKFDTAFNVNKCLTQITQIMGYPSFISYCVFLFYVFTDPGIINQMKQWGR